MLSRAIPQLTRSFRRAVSTVTPSNKSSATLPAPKHGSTTTQQAPNYPTSWSTNQAPRPGPGTSPRFEQTNMELQPNPLSAMELIANEPVRIVHGRKAVCDGGLVLFCTFILSWLTVSHLVVSLLKSDHIVDPACLHLLVTCLTFLHEFLEMVSAPIIGGGPLGHPKIYINLVSTM